MNPNLVRLVKRRAAAVLVESKSIQKYGLAFSPNDNLNTIASLMLPIVALLLFCTIGFHESASQETLRDNDGIDLMHHGEIGSPMCKRK